MGQAKLLLPWGSATVIERVLAAWTASCVRAVAVVVRAGDERLADICRRCGAEVVVADPPPQEMQASVVWGLRYLQQRFGPQEDDVWLLAPADMPRLAPAVIDRLVDAWRPDDAILVPTFGGRRGHPVLISWRLAAEVPQLTGGRGVRELLDRHPVRVLQVDDPAVLDDVDTPSDYHNLHNRRSPP